MPNLWRLTSRNLLAFQALVALGILGLGASLTIEALNCPASCGLAGLGVLLLGATWIAGGTLGAVVLITLIVVSLKSKWRGALVVTVAGEALLLLPEVRLHALMKPFGLPEIGLYILAAAIAADLTVILLSVVTLAIAIDVGRHTPLVVSGLTILPFVIAAIASL